ncbi:GntR family transcriptional regulator [Nocardiopsis ansamitocini]|uniref:GntR family transcriptional regulator n=1 Tax=Nocardiopsis ansamitocini TaxID=1670832 RepID=A0A9W6P303_9ACTN|nr:GntR family transcriptional regulator [Nocardiopsis ansamitocini]GLU46147.1 GntR family transcriptional regulator [Nocardiopsis ansamitocini]
MIDAPRSRYQQVADLIREAIQRGDYAPGSALPSQPTLAGKYGINQTSIGKAIALLRREGLVRVIKGKGAYVREIPPISRYAVTRYAEAVRESGTARGAFDAEMAQRGHESRTELVQWGETVAPQVASDALDLTAGAKVAIRKRHMHADDVPVQIATSYVPWELAKGTAIAEQDTGSGGTYSRLAEAGHTVERFTETIRSRMPTPEEADFLRLDEDQPVYDVLHTAWTAEGRAVEICVHVMPTTQWVLHYEWPAS